MKTITYCFLLVFTACLLACNPKPGASVETTETADTLATPPVPAESGLLINNFGNDSTGIDSVWLVDNSIIILGKPVNEVARKIKINEDEAACLKKCKKADGSYDLDCILRCPVSKRFTFTIPAWKSVQ